MKITSPLITLFTILALTACSQNPPTNPPKVDRLSLIWSMTYTHRHLLEQQLDSQVEETSRRQLLIQSHCDLIKRGVVHTEPMPALCPSSVPYDVQVCIVQFHRCIGACGTFMDKCSSCEQRAERCLDQGATGEVSM